jgi:hypothetical protein
MARRISIDQLCFTRRIHGGKRMEGPTKPLVGECRVIMLWMHDSHAKSDVSVRACGEDEYGPVAMKVKSGESSSGTTTGAACFMEIDQGRGGGE